MQCGSSWSSPSIRRPSTPGALGARGGITEPNAPGTEGTRCSTVLRGGSQRAEFSGGRHGTRGGPEFGMLGQATEAEHLVRRTKAESGGSRAQQVCVATDPALHPRHLASVSRRTLRMEDFCECCACSQSALNRLRYQAVRPPSTTRSCAVMKLAASLSRKMVGPTISSTSASRPIGVCDLKRSSIGRTAARWFISVSV